MKNFHSLTTKECFKELRSGAKGLSDREARKRIKKYGLNQIESSKPLSGFFILKEQFKNPLIFVLLVAGVFSIFFQEFVDAGVIFGAIFLNVLMGFFQESKANNALAKLRKIVEHKALVYRDGQEKEINSVQLVLGDVILLDSGRRVPADARIIESDDLKIVEASLTGESDPSDKSTATIQPKAPLADKENMAYAGTVVASGKGKALIVAVGSSTEIGKIANLVKGAEKERTPLQVRLHKLSKFIGLLVFFVCLAVILIGVWQGRDFLEMFITGAAIAVAAVPEGLIIAVTVILALGMQRILKENALTRKLIAAETLGSTTVICADKTGTLTEGKMNLSMISVGEKEFELKKSDSVFTKEESAQVKIALKIGIMCNGAVVENPKDGFKKWRIIGSPTETALLLGAKELGIDKINFEKKEKKIDELPFDSAYKYMITLYKTADAYMVYEKGAAEKLLEKSAFLFYEGRVVKIDKNKKKKLLDNYENLTAKGFRVIGVAYKEVKNLDWQKNKKDWKKIDKDLIFAGFLLLQDPLRSSAKETIKLCQMAGIKPIIITGDHKLTAKKIAEEIGLRVGSKNILTGDALDDFSDKKLEKIVNKIDIYARVSPHHKLRIVKALQARGEVVAMTGDGINDSPALKIADIGISLGTATDIAKESSDLVLLDNDFKTIVLAVKQGRIIFANIRKVVTYLVSDGFSIVILIVGSILLGMPLAMLPTQILWINIVNDGLPSFALAFENEDENILKDKPIKQNEAIVNKEMKFIIFIAGLIRDFFIFGIFFYLIKNNFETNYIRTVVFAAVGVNSLMYIFSLKNFKKSLWQTNIFNNFYLIWAVLASLILLLGAIYIPFLQKILSTVALDFKIWGVIALTGVLMIAMIEVIKHFFVIKNEK